MQHNMVQLQPRFSLFNSFCTWPGNKCNVLVDCPLHFQLALELLQLNFLRLSASSWVFEVNSTELSLIENSNGIWNTGCEPASDILRFYVMERSQVERAFLYFIIFLPGSSDITAPWYHHHLCEESRNISNFFTLQTNHYGTLSSVFHFVLYNIPYINNKLYSIQWKIIFNSYILSFLQ